MGVGKTEVGMALAHQLNLDFIDLDSLIVERCNKTITEIFDEEGEEKFRRIENKITQEVAAKNNYVIACGGGTVLNDENLQSLRKNSILILLTADPRTIYQRITSDGGTRPLLNVEDQIEKISSLLFRRFPIYLEAADMIVDSSSDRPEKIAREIIASLKRVGYFDC
jgi:shikimate kinase